MPKVKRSSEYISLLTEEELPEAGEKKASFFEVDSLLVPDSLRKAAPSLVAKSPESLLGEMRTQKGSAAIERMLEQLDKLVTFDFLRVKDVNELGSFHALVAEGKAAVKEQLGLGEKLKHPLRTRHLNQLFKQMCKRIEEVYLEQKKPLEACIKYIRECRSDDAIYLLENHRVKIDEQDSKERSLLHLAVSYELVAVVDHLIKRGANIEALDYKGRKPEELSNSPSVRNRIGELRFNSLLYDNALKRGNYEEALQILKTQPVSFYVSTNLGGVKTLTTLLHLAAYYGKLPLIEYLNEQQFPLDARDGSLRTALHIAAQNDRKDCVESLLNKGCPIEVKDRDALSEIDHAFARGNLETYLYLREHVKNVSSLALSQLVKQGLPNKGIEVLVEHLEPGCSLLNFQISKRTHWLNRVSAGNRVRLRTAIEQKPEKRQLLENQVFKTNLLA